MGFRTLAAILVSFTMILMISAEFMFAATPFNTLMTSLNSTMASTTGATGDAWNFWGKYYNSNIKLYGVIAVVLILFYLAWPYLVAQQSEFTTGRIV